MVNLMPPATATKQTRKRNRKRKRRAASSSSSSSDITDESSGEQGPELPSKTPPPASAAVKLQSSDSNPSSSESESEDTSSSEAESGASSDGDSGHEAVKHVPSPVQNLTPEVRSHRAHVRASPSPSPPPATLPSFIPPKDNDCTKRNQEMQEKFRKFWMASVADGFRDDLEQIRKEPNMNTSKLTMLIDSLASGADVFGSSDKDGVDEVAVMLG